MTVANIAPAVVEVAVFSEAHPEEEVRRHLTHALRQLRAKSAVIDTLWRYFDGDHPQLWMTEKLRETFGREFSQALHDNFCELVVDSRVRRLAVVGWAARAEPGTIEEAEAGEDDAAPKPTEPDPDRLLAAAAEIVWADNDLDLDQSEVYRSAGVAGEAYVIVWPHHDDDGTQRGFDVSYNDARNVHLEYGSSRRRDRKWAAKVWLDGDANAWRANIYYPDELVRLVGRANKTDGRAPAFPTTPNAFELDQADPGGDNEFGKVPVVAFYTHRRFRSWLHNAIPVQNKINKLAANKMVAAEFLAWGQRWIMSGDETLSKDKLRPSPGSVLVIDPGTDDEEAGGGGRTQVGEWNAAQLDNYDNSKGEEVDTLFTITSLPKHLRKNPGADPSGDAIKADEGPFVAVVKDCSRLFGASWQDVFDLMRLRVDPVWIDPEVHNEEALAKTVLALTQAGVPVDIAVARVARWSDADVEELKRRVKEQQQATADAAAAALQAFDQGRSVGDVTESNAPVPPALA